MGNLLIMAALAAVVKALAQRYPVTEILFFRFAFATLALLFMLPAAGGLRSLKTGRVIDHGVRSLCGITALGLFYYAVSVIPLADATTLAYAAPIFIVVFSIPILGEKIGSRRWTAVMLGFVGVVLIAKPTGGTWNLGALAGIASAITGALVSIWLRRLSATEQFTTIGIIYNTTGGILFGLWCTLSIWVRPRGLDLVILSGLGLAAGLQQAMFTLSYRYAEASFLAPFEYFILVIAVVIGFVFWGEVPSLSTWLGGIIIALSGIFVIFRTHLRKAPDGN